MIRLTALTLTLVALLPALPVGCPTSQPTNDSIPTARGLLTTTAEAPESATVGETVTLRAATTVAADDGTVYYAWLQTAGPGAKITSADQSAASFVAPSLPTGRVLRFMVTTSNDAGDVGRAEVSVRVTANPNYSPYDNDGTGTIGPVAAAGEDRTVSEGDTVTLDGSGSTGLKLHYAWRQISGTTVTLANAAAAAVATLAAPAYSASGDNTLVFELAVTDGANQTVTDRVRVTIRNPGGHADAPRVRVTTSMGAFVIELDPEKAPVTVANFLGYVDDSFYDGTLIHRVMPDFVIQGGGYQAGMVEKTAGDTIINESDNGLNNVRGSIGMARLTAPNSARAQFYVNLVDNDSSDYKAGQPGYAVFGQVVEGMDIVDQIAAVETETQGDFENVPVQNILINSIARVE